MIQEKDQMIGRIDVEDLGKPLALRLAVMVQTWLVSYREFAPWADAIIERLDAPPLWVLNLTTKRYVPDAVRVLREGGAAARPEPGEPYPPGPWTDADEEVACHLLRHERGEISWATFLREAGNAADPDPCRRACEYFYGKLGDLEDADYAADLAVAQRADVASGFADVIASVRDTYEYMRRFRSPRH